MQDNKISFDDAFELTQKEENQKPKQSVSFEEVFKVNEDAPDFIPGVHRGLQNLQASLYGAGALAGEGLKKLGADSTGQSLKDFGLEGYKRNIEEAKQYPKKHSFKDIYTGKTGVGGAIDWAQGTLGELVPSMVEAAAGAVIGGAIGSAIPVAGTGAGAVTGAFATRTVLKKGIEKTIQQALKKGIGDITESQLRKQVTRQALKKLGGKVGIAGAVMPMESGGSYAGLLEEHGVDAPETAMLFGALKTSLEFIPGGNAKLVDTFVDALSKGATGMVKKTAKELLINIPSEALQEGGQELLDILNTVVNTDEKLLTWENVEKIIESAAAGAVGGGAGAVVQAGVSSQATAPGLDKTDQEIELDRLSSNILTQDKEGIDQSIQKLNDNIKSNQEILNDYQKLDAKATELNIEPTALIDQFLAKNNSNKSLIEKINTGITEQGKLKQKEYEQLSPEEKAIKDVADKLAAQRSTDAQKINADIKALDERLSLVTKQYQEEIAPEKKKLIAERIFALRKEKNTLLDTQQVEQATQVKEFAAPKKADEIRQEKADFYNQLWPGRVSKDAAESAQTFESNTVQQEEILQQILQEKDLQKRQELQDTYNQMFQTFEQDAATSAEIFAAQGKDVVANQRKQELQQTMDRITKESDPAVRQKLYNQMFVQPGVKSAQESADVFTEEEKSLAEAEKSLFKDEPQVPSMSELEEQLTVNEQQLSALAAQLNNTTDPNERIALQQEGAILFEQNAFLEDQWNKQYQAQEQIQSAEVSAETAGFDSQFEAYGESEQSITEKNFREFREVTKKPILSNFDYMMSNGDIIPVSGHGAVGNIPSFLRITKGIRLHKTEKGSVAMEIHSKVTPEQITKLKVALRGATDVSIEVFDTTGNKIIDDDFFSVQYAINSLEKIKDPQTQVREDIKATTTLHDTLIQTKQDTGLTGQLSEFLSQFIPESKFDIPVIIDPTVKSAKYNRKTGITLRDPSELKSSLHEIVHAVTVREMDANKSIKDKVTFLMSIVEEEAIRAGHLTPKQINDIKSAGGSKAFKNKFPKESEVNKVGHLAYSLLNEKEFLAQAFSSVQVQEFMRSIQTTRKEQGKLKTLWDDFIELIMTSLGIAKTHKTVFGETLKLTAELAQANIKETDQVNLAETNIYYDALIDVNDQKLPQAEYDEIYAQQNNFIKEIAQQARIKFTEVKLLADKTLGSISTRLKNVDPELSEHLRWLGFNTRQNIINVLKIAEPLLDATNGVKNKLGIRQGGMTPKDKSDWNWARLQADKGKIEQLAQKYSITDHLINVREALDKIRAEAIKVGYDVGYIDEYWPRVIKDQEGFLQATQGISQRADFTEAIRAQAKKLGLTQEQFERDFPEVKADIISNLILSQSTGIGGPGNIQSRVYETIDKDYAKFYMDADAALMQYVYSMTKKIEARKFFGKVPQRISALKSAYKRKHADILKYEQLADMARAENPERLAEYKARIQELNEDLVLIEEPLNLYKGQNNYTENIGSYIDRMRVDGRIQPKDEKVVRDILAARFNEHGTTGIVNAYKNLSYIDTMGSPLSAITQIGDLAWAMYVGKVWTPKGFSDTAKNLSRAILHKSNITKEDIGIERIAQEFADNTTLSKAVTKVFKAVQLERIDTIGKELLINNALDQFKAQAKNNPEALAKLIKPTFGNKSTDVVQEILALAKDPDANPSDNVKMLLYSRLLDFQPVALSEMPEYYLTGGNGRVFYMLKTYTLKQFDVFRKEVVHNLKSENPQQKIQGITNMVQLMALLTLANATADEIKDFMLGKETRFSDNVIENFLTLGGASRYLKMQITKEGFGSALSQQILPPMKFINSASKDIQEGYKNYVSGDTANFDHARIIDSIPGVGKRYYWHYGRGSESKKSLAENDFKKATKDTRLFKKQLENSDDKRFFIESNLDRFKQMKVHGNFQTALNRNQAVVNKLEKIPSTENIQTRLGQLKQQREQILQRYFDVAEGLN